MLSGKTTSGYKYNIPEEKLSDWRIVKKLARLKSIDGESDEAVLDFINIMSEIEEILFDDKGEAFETHILKKNDGIVAPAVALQELMEILNSSKTSKN